MFLASDKKRYNDSRWNELHKTASGNYVIEWNSLWQGEHNYFEICNKKEAMDFMLEYASYEDAVSEFPEVETLEDQI
jgi:hypothetical protein